MSIFNLHETVLNDYRRYVQSFIMVSDPRAREFIESQLVDESRLWPNALLQVSPSYTRVASVDDLAAQGTILPQTAQIFRNAQRQPFYLYQHQVDALARANHRNSYVVTSGTGSGKSLTYFLPIIDNLLRHPPTTERVAALVIYPMNALVNSQLAALNALKSGYERSTGRPFPVRFSKYTGDVQGQERQSVQNHPPQILLTNYVMAELLLVRPTDQGLLPPRGMDGLRYLVFDELHTYRGRQGADVSMLIRRLKDRSASPGLICVGTSATMVSNRDDSSMERRTAVSRFSSTVFGQTVLPDNVIEETLEPYTLGGSPSPEELTASLDFLPTGLDEFRRHPLARWAERQFGIEPDGTGWRRRIPCTLAESAEELHEITAVPVHHCEERLRQLLIWGGGQIREDGGRAFAFKIHQFISQGRSAYATLEPTATREFSLEGQSFAEGRRPLIPIKFCRCCGQDYYHVIRNGDQMTAHQSTFDSSGGGVTEGYLMIAPQENDWSEDQAPEEWRQVNGRFRESWRDRVPQAIWVGVRADAHSNPQPGAMKMWWQADPFALCLNCGEFYSKREREYTKLATLSSEGRSSSTTILASALLRRAGAEEVRSKLLSFSDNRQDASLQSGHFNDFIHVSLLRSALYTALAQANQLTFDRVADAVVLASGLTPRHVAGNAQLDPQSDSARDVMRAFTDLTEYRLYDDLRRGWRVVQPNLESVGLLRIYYQGLEGLCENARLWEFHPALARLPVEEKITFIRAILDQFRRRLAIFRECLTESAQQQIRRRAEQHLNEFWGLDEESDLRPATQFIWWGRSTRPVDGFSLGERSALARFVNRTLDLSPGDYVQLMPQILRLLVNNGFLRQLDSVEDHQLYQLDAAKILWRLSDGRLPDADPLYARRSAVVRQGVTRMGNDFFREFYQGPAVALAALESREHTAQVVKVGERERRERRFRMTSDDLGQAERPLPFLVCSPTMELGVDIADLDLVHLRNVPPTPANYAQRSGRAGRQGQPGLVITYCGASNTHDQYFFRERTQMVAGSVRPPMLEIANEALVRAHLHAVWLSEVRLPLGDSISSVIDIDNVEELGLNLNARTAIQLNSDVLNTLTERGRGLLTTDLAFLNASGWFSDHWVANVFANAATSFDRAFDRWRDLYRAADGQLEQAHREQRRARTTEAREMAERLNREASAQIGLLLQDSGRAEDSDFYPYRYLASEGFLPGYNFPALPVRAWVPKGDGEYVTRPRFQALREFGPNNVLYHEGNKWEVVSLQPPAGGLAERRNQRRICGTCGSFCDLGQDICPNCATAFNGMNCETIQLLEQPNVRCRRRERITCDEEERRRRGFEIKLTYQFASDGLHRRVREADVCVEDAPVLRLTYGPAATVMRINRGWKNSASWGFLINLQDGRVVNATLPQTNGAVPTQQNLERVQMSVQSAQNILLVRPLTAELRIANKALWVAIQRGIEQLYQLEESELGAESIGDGEWQSQLFYETGEGGVGVLRRLVEEPDALARVVREALNRCHFDLTGADLRPTCIAACYQCLKTFSNQLFSTDYDRHQIRDTLIRLSCSRTFPLVGERDWHAHLAWLRSRIDSRSDLERHFLDLLEAGHHRLPDEAQKLIEDPRCMPDFFYTPNICVFCDGSVHDVATRREEDRVVRDQLRQRGYDVVVLRYDTELRQQISGRADVFGPRNS